MATISTDTALDRFIETTRELFSKEADPEKRWTLLNPILTEMLADKQLQLASEAWPECVVTDRAQNLLFYEDKDYGFAINGLKNLPGSRTNRKPHPVHPSWKGIHDHAHIYTLYGVLVGRETIERYDRLDDRSKADYAEIKLTETVNVAPGFVDLVRPYEIHAERSLGETTVAVIVRSQKAGGFNQGRYSTETGEYWEGLGPRQIPVDMFGAG